MNSAQQAVPNAAPPRIVVRGWPGAFVRGRDRWSPHTIGLMLVLLAMAARLSVLVRQRAYGEFASIDVFASAEIAIVMVTLAIVFTNSRLMPTLYRSGGTGVWPLLGFFGVGALSMLWSPMWAYSAYRSVSVLSQFLAVVLLLSYCPDFRTAEKRILQIAGVVLLLQWLTFGRSGGVSAMFSLRRLHNNTLATSAAMVACYCIGEGLVPGIARQRRKMLRRLGGVALVAVLVGTSAGSNVSTAVGLLVACALVRRGDLFLLIATLGILGTYVVSLDAVQSVLMPGKSAEQIASLRGRVYLWDIYKERFSDHALLGEGYAVSARLASHYSTNTHNAYLSVLLGTGVVGFAFFVVAMAVSGFKLVSRTLTRRPGAVGATAGLAAGLSNAMTKGFLGEGYYPETLVFFSIFALAALHIIPGNRATARPG